MEANKTKKRFQIDQLEERIAPARGGIPGPDGNALENANENANHGEDGAGSKADPPGRDGGGEEPS